MSGAWALARARSTPATSITQSVLKPPFSCRRPRYPGAQDYAGAADGRTRSLSPLVHVGEPGHPKQGQGARITVRLGARPEGTAPRSKARLQAVGRRFESWPMGPRRYGRTATPTIIVQSDGSGVPSQEPELPQNAKVYDLPLSGKAPTACLDECRRSECCTDGPSVLCTPGRPKHDPSVGCGLGAGSGASGPSRVDLGWQVVEIDAVAVGGHGPPI